MTDRYAVIGNPIAHSKSPALHAAFARQCAQDIEYTRILGPLDGFVATVREFQRSGGKGLNVTVPFKQEAYALADELSERARLAGAANTLTLRADGSIHGDNTDGVGIVRDIVNNIGRPLAGQRILLLGAGGAVRGVLAQILAERPAGLLIANRTADNARKLADLFAPFAGGTEFAACGFAEVAGAFDIVINGSSSSLSDDVPPLPAEVWRTNTLAYDMTYASAPTAFVRAARAAGAGLATDGLGMLVEQGAESFFIWRGLRPETAALIESLR